MANPLYPGIHVAGTRGHCMTLKPSHTVFRFMASVAAEHACATAYKNANTTLLHKIHFESTSTC